MTTRIDELFSPERLRRNWSMSANTVDKTGQSISDKDIHATFYQLQQLIAASYADITPLTACFTEISDKILAVFPLNSEQSADDAQKNALIEKLDELEELLFSMDLANRTRMG